MKSFTQYINLQERSAALVGRDITGSSSYTDDEGEALQKLVKIVTTVARSHTIMMISALRRMAATDPSGEIESALKELDEIGISKLRRAAAKGNSLPSGDANPNADIIVPNTVDAPGESGME